MGRFYEIYENFMKIGDFMKINSGSTAIIFQIST